MTANTFDFFDSFPDSSAHLEILSELSPTELAVFNAVYDSIPEDDVLTGMFVELCRQTDVDFAKISEDDANNAKGLILRILQIAATYKAMAGNR